MAIIYKDGKPVVVPGGEPGQAPTPQPEEEIPLEDTRITRRKFMRNVFLSTMGLFTVGAVGSFVVMFWPKKVGTFGSTIKVGDISEFPPGSVTRIPDGRFYLVHTLPEQGGGFLALYWKCVHLGCTVPWRDTEDGTYNGKTYSGIFHHGPELCRAGPAPARYYAGSRFGVNHFGQYR